MCSTSLFHIIITSSRCNRVLHLPNIIKVEPQHRPDGHTQCWSSCQQKHESVKKRLRSQKSQVVTWSHPSQWWCTSRSNVFQGRRSPPTGWRGTDPRWRARSSWTERSNERRSSQPDILAAKTGPHIRGGGREGVPETPLGWDAHRMDEAVLTVFLRVQHAVFDEHWDGPQDERHKQVHVDEVASAVQLPEHRADPD